MNTLAQDRGTFRVMPEIDYPLLTVVAVLLGLGMVMVVSATLHAKGGNPSMYAIRHLIALGIALAAGLVVLLLPLRFLERWGWIGYLVGVGLLVLVIIPGVGVREGGAVRWFKFAGFTVQASEYMKLFMVIYLAGYLARHREAIHRLWGFVRPMLLLVGVAVLLMLEPDFGTTVVLVGAAVGMLFLGGVALSQFALLGALGGVALVALVLFSGYRLERVTSFLNPWDDVRDTDYQLANALIAFGRGEWFGVGLGSGVQKLFYLPAAHTDFLLAVVGEELGLVGTLTVLALFIYLVYRGFRIGIEAERLKRPFAAFLAQGIALWLGIQAGVNAGVNVGLLPTKGLTLPFIAYGGNSLIVSVVAVALLLRVDYENRQAALPKPHPASRPEPAEVPA